MPKKRNFLGGMQNYNPNNGEYEPNLVGSNGKVVKDADGDGISHESKKLPKLNNDYKTDKNGNKYLEFSSEKEAHGYFNNHDLPDGTVVYDNKIYFGKEEQDFNDPSEAEHNKAEEKEFSEVEYEKKTDTKSNEDVEGINDEEIDEELFDRTWAITDKTSVKDYAELISENLKVPYERVLARIRKNKPEAKETDKMSVVAELED